MAARTPALRMRVLLRSCLIAGLLNLLLAAPSVYAQCGCSTPLGCDDCASALDYSLDPDGTGLPPDPGQVPDFAVSEQFASFGGTAFAASLPSVMGDTQSGGCGGLFFEGSLGAVIDHPSYACTRLNIAENNSPIVRDRVSMTYRHLHAASVVSIFPDSFKLPPEDNHIDRWTFTLERRLTEQSSIEIRVPVNYQLSAENIIFYRAGNNNLHHVYNNMHGEFGNMSAIFKRTLLERPGLYVSGGVGVNIPTAPDIRVAGDIDGDLQILRMGNLEGHNLDMMFDGSIDNETINVMPFLAVVRANPNTGWFQQGFVQIDVPANRSSSQVTISELVVDNVLAAPFQVYNFEVQQQTLMRLNSQLGYTFFRAPNSRISAVSAIFEVHYTTTLNGAMINDRTIFNAGGTFVNLQVGNPNNRVDVLNMVAGLPIEIGDWTLYNGVTVPLRDGADRGFDFEYTMILDGRFR